MSAPELARHPVFEGVEPDLLAEFVRRGQVLRPADGAEVLSEGDPEPAFFVLLAGSVKVLYRSEQGVEVVVKLLEAPAVFGEMECIAGIPPLETVQAIERVRLVKVPAQTLLHAVRTSHALCAQLLSDVAKRLCIAAQLERALAFQPVESRLAQLLLTYLDMYGLPAEGGQMIRIPITQESLAQAVGVNRRSVTRTLQGWTEQGWLTKVSGRYVITQREALERVTDPQLLRIGYRSGASLAPR